MQNHPRVLLIGAACALLIGCAPATTIETGTTDANVRIPSLIALVRNDATKRPMLAEALVTQQVWMIPDPHANRLAVLPFDQNERSFIPVFSDRKTFDVEAYGTGFENKAIAVAGKTFASLLNEDAIVVLNPGDRPAIEFKGSELKAIAQR
jgi:hypothetical protein